MDLIEDKEWCANIESMSLNSSKDFNSSVELLADFLSSSLKSMSLNSSKDFSSSVEMLAELDDVIDQDLLNDELLSLSEKVCGHVKNLLSAQKSSTKEARL